MNAGHRCSSEQSEVDVDDDIQAFWPTLWDFYSEVMVIQRDAWDTLITVSMVSNNHS